MTTEHDPIKPPDEVLEANDSLEDLLTHELKTNGPKTPENLLKLARNSAVDNLTIVSEYLRNTGFTPRRPAGIPVAVVLYALGISYRTGVGRRTRLTNVLGERVVEHFPGFSRDMPLLDYLRADLTEYPRRQTVRVSGRPRVIFPRETRAIDLYRDVIASIRGSEPRRSGGIRMEQLTIGSFLELPLAIIETNRQIYDMLGPYGFRSPWL
ncbi:hypothetical protein HYU16_01345 [Candidatus Woesearchaeota archaeon]|nr:hypothetical protein [Candidatus Woesearchaeota archaeon]